MAIDYTGFLKKNKFDLMPDKQKEVIRQEFVSKNFGDKVKGMSPLDREVFVSDIYKQMSGLENQFLQANMGPKPPPVDTEDLTPKQRNFYKQKVKEDISREIKQSGDSGATFTDFLDKFSKNTGKIFNSPTAIISAINPFNAAETGFKLGAAADVARADQAREYMQRTDSETIPADAFPDVLIGQGMRQMSGLGRLANTFNDKYDFNKPLQGEKPKDMFDPEFKAEGTAGNMLLGVGALIGDAPLLLSGPIKGFALMKMAQSWAEVRETGIREGREVTFNDMKNVVLETGKGAAIGATVGVTSKIPGFLVSKMKTSFANALTSKGFSSAGAFVDKFSKVVELGLDITADTTATLGMEGLLNAAAPTTTQQEQSNIGDYFTPDAIVQNALTMGMFKGLQKYGAKRIDPITKETYDSFTVGKKLGDIEHKVERIYKGGDSDINTTLLRKDIQKTFTPGELNDLAAKTNTTPTEILNSSIESFKDISSKFRNDAITKITDATADSIVEMDGYIVKSMAEDTRQTMIDQLKVEQIKSQTGKSPAEIKKSIDDFVGDSVVAPEPTVRTETLLDQTVRKLYGRGEGEGTFARRTLEDFLVGRDKVVNKTAKDFEIFSAEGKTPEFVDSSGVKHGGVKQGVLPISRGEANAVKKFIDMPYEPIKGAWKPNSKEILDKLGEDGNKMFVEPVRDVKVTSARDHTLDARYVKSYRKELGVSRKDMNEVRKYMIAENISGKESLARAKEKAPETLTPKQQAWYEFSKQWFLDKQIIHNNARMLAGMDPMGSVDNYYPMFRKFTWREKMGFNKKAEVFEDNIFIDEMLSRDPASFSKSREFTDRAVESDMMETMLKYSREFYDTTYMLPVTAKMKKLLNPMKGPDGEIVSLKEKSPATHKFLSEYVKDLEGIPRYENTLGNNIARMAGKNLSRSMIGANTQSMVNQLAANIGMMTEMPIAALKTAPDMLNPAKIKEWTQLSKHLDTMIVDAAIAGSKGSPLSVRNALRHPVQAATHLTFAPLRASDGIMRVWSWGTAFNKARASGIDKVNAARYADRKTIDWNASGAIEDLANIQKTPVGKFFTLFGTHPIMFANWIGKDIIGIRKKTVPFKGSKISPKGVKTKRDFSQSFLRDPEKMFRMMTGLVVTAGTAHIYESLGFYSPVPAPALGVAKLFGYKDNGEPDSEQQALKQVLVEGAGFLPYGGSTLEYGSSGLLGPGVSSVVDFGEKLSGWVGYSKKSRRYSTGDVVNSAAVLLGVPGAKQFMKTMRKYEQKKKELDKKYSGSTDYEKMQKEYKKAQDELTKPYRDMMKEYEKSMGR